MAEKASSVRVVYEQSARECCDPCSGWTTLTPSRVKVTFDCPADPINRSELAAALRREADNISPTVADRPPNKIATAKMIKELRKSLPAIIRQAVADAFAK